MLNVLLSQVWVLLQFITVSVYLTQTGKTWTCYVFFSITLAGLVLIGRSSAVVFFPHSVSPLSFPLSFILFYLCPSFSLCFPCCLLSNLSLFLFMALCLCRVLGMNGIASIWKCSGDDIEHMWPWLTGQALCGDHTVSLVAGRRNKKGMYNYFKQGRHCERRERSGDGVGCIVSCRSWVCVFVCVRTTYLVTSQQSFQLNGSRKAR